MFAVHAVLSFKLEPIQGAQAKQRSDCPSAPTLDQASSTPARAWVCWLVIGEGLARANPGLPLSMLIYNPIAPLCTKGGTGPAAGSPAAPNIKMAQKVDLEMQITADRMQGTEKKGAERTQIDQLGVWRGGVYGGGACDEQHTRNSKMGWGGVQT